MVQLSRHIPICAQATDNTASYDSPDQAPLAAPDRPRRRLSHEHARQPALTPDQQILAAENLGLVRVHLRTRLRIRPRARTTRREFDELFQAGCLALVQAAARYNPQSDGPFPSYVLPRIRRAVHAAVLAGRSLMHVPYGTACRRRRRGLRGGAPGRRYWPARDRSHTGADGGPACAGLHRDESTQADCETIRHALRRRFERAAHQAKDDLARSARREDALTIFARITAERIVVSNARERTPVRQLAGELGLSSGQVSEYEQRLLDATRERLREDSAALLLIRFANIDPDGFDGPVDDRRRRRLLCAQLRQFERRFAAFSPAERAHTLYSLVERSAIGVGEVARNLFLLTLANP